MNAVKRIAGSIFGKLKKILLILGIIVAVPIAAALGGSVYIMTGEYKPAPIEDARRVSPGGYEADADYALPAGGTVRIMTMNIGGGSSGAGSDSFLYGGSGVRPGSKSVTDRNLGGIERLLASEGADMYLLQEVDEKSKRSFKINELAYFSDRLDMPGVYACASAARYVPYPFPTYGAVSSGLLTLSKYAAPRAERLALPGVFTWPVRIVAPKRCLLVTRIPVGDTGDELVVVNLQFEARRPESAHEMLLELASFMSVEYEAGNYVIAGGDFAALFPEADNGKYPLYADSSFMPVTLDGEALRDGLLFKFDDSRPTMRLLDMPFDPQNPEHQFFVTDGFIISKNLAVNGIRVVDGEFEFAAHNPVIINVTLK